MAVWVRATEHYGSDLERILGSAISSYKRAPGLESPSRLYAQDLGIEGLEALHRALLRSRASRFHVLNPGIEMRQSLRLHRFIACGAVFSMMARFQEKCAISTLPST